MSNEIAILIFTAASIGFLHTLFGPDHYLPFIVMARANHWSRLKTVWITALCGIGHVASSVVLGIIGIALGIAITKIEAFESMRGNFAAWVLMGFGMAYFAWGLHKAIKGKPHTHAHIHEDGVVHSHNHTHKENHAHLHPQEKSKNLTPWILFTIFVLGPCEPLIPLLMYPAAKNSLEGLILVTAVFGSITILTMLGVVILVLLGIGVFPIQKVERYVHAIAGAAILLSGAGIQFLGL